MKNIYKIIFYITSAIYLFIVNENAISSIKNKKYKLKITSEKQLIDISTNTLIFSGNVLVNYKSIKIEADKIKVSKKNNVEIIEGYGKPVIFYKSQNNNKYILGKALKIIYDTKNCMISLIGNVYLESENKQIKSDQIYLLINKHFFKAISKPGHQVVTTITINI